MDTKNKRPINIDVFQYRFPATAIASVLHRISGVVIFLFLPFLLWMLDRSLLSAVHFQQLQQCFTRCGWFRLLVWILLTAVLYHLVAGVRHMIMDMGFGESKQKSRVSAYLVMIIAALLSVLAGVWLW